MKTKKIVLTIVLLAAILATAGCTEKKPDPDRDKNLKIESRLLNDPGISANVSFYARSDGSGWIENNNDFPVTIKAIFIERYEGEITRYIRTVGAKEKLDEEHMLNYRYFVTVNCTEKAFVNPIGRIYY